MTETSEESEGGNRPLNMAPALKIQLVLSIGAGLVFLSSFNSCFKLLATKAVTTANSSEEVWAGFEVVLCDRLSLFMAAVLSLFSLLTVLNLKCCQTATFVMLPSFAKSHFLVFARLSEELKRRGHKVRILVGDTESYASSHSNVQVYKTPEKFFQMTLTRHGPKKGLDVVTEMSNGARLKAFYCEGLLNNKELLNEIRNADLIIGDALYMCSSLIANKFSLPHVVILLETLSLPSMHAFGVPLAASYVPQFKSTMTDDMSLVERLKNLYHWILVYWAFHRGMVPPFYELKERYNIAPGRSIRETLDSVDLILSQRPFILEYARPLLPNTKVVGPLVAAPAKPLPEELEECFFQRSGIKGVILVSFGTVLANRDGNILSLLADAFSKLPYYFIWKLHREKMKIPLSKNIKVASWLPQNDILGHKNTKLFINHGGVHGLMEAAYHGVPVICSPVFGDQYDNAHIAKEKGFGEVIDLDTITTDDLVEVIRKVVSNQSYRESAVRLSKFITRLPRSPVNEAADWIEYTQTMGGLQHLRPRGLDLPLYKYYFLDVLLLFFVTTVFMLFILKYLGGSLWIHLRASAATSNLESEKNVKKLE